MSAGSPREACGGQGWIMVHTGVSNQTRNSRITVPAMRLSDFDYDLPADLIAQHPMPERTGSRLLVVGEASLDDLPFAALPDLVAAGDLLIRLDAEALRSELATVEGQLLEVLARRARFEAEEVGADTLQFNPLLTEGGNPMAAELMAGAQGLFEARLETARSETEQLTRRREQVDSQIEGVEAQAELDMLVGLGVRHMQGYLLCPPCTDPPTAGFVRPSRLAVPHDRAHGERGAIPA